MSNPQTVKYLVVLLTSLLAVAGCSTKSETVTVGSLAESGVEQVTPETIPATVCLDEQTLIGTTGEGNAESVTGEDNLCETPATEPTESEPIESQQEPTDQGLLEEDFTEIEPFVLEKSDIFVTNRNDKTSPIGRLCWVLEELSIKLLMKWDEVITEYNPWIDIVYPDMDEPAGDVSGALGLVDVTPDEEFGDDSLIQDIQNIREFEAVIVNDTELSSEVKSFAEGYFDNIAELETQIRDGVIDDLVRETLNSDEGRPQFPIFTNVVGLFSTSEIPPFIEEVGPLLNEECVTMTDEEYLVWSDTQDERLRQWNEEWDEEIDRILE